MKRLATFAIAMLLVTSAVSAGPLFFGETLNKPDVLPAPNYSTTLPAYFVPENLIAIKTVPYDVVVGSLTGEVTSAVYLDPGTLHLGFTYQFTSTGNAPVVRVGFGSGLMQNILIDDAGSLLDGSSTAAPNSPKWEDGSPAFIERELQGSGGGVSFQWRVGSTGTSLYAGDFSALIFLDTEATGYSSSVMGIIDSGSISTGDVYAPMIPEPGLGLVSIVLPLLLKRRRSC